MATKKKRNKKYRGIDAASSPTRVTRVSVPHRSAAGKWWHENGQKWTRRLATVGVGLIIFGIISFIFRLVF